MEWHNWRCRECNQVSSQIGLTSLSFAVQLHDKEIHGLTTNRTAEEIMRCPQYFTSSYAYTIGGSGVPTMEEYKWLRRQFILWDGDNRTPAELALRYRNNRQAI